MQKMSGAMDDQVVRNEDNVFLHNRPASLKSI